MTQADFNNQTNRRLNAIEKALKSITDASTIQMKIVSVDTVNIASGALIPFTNITFKTPDMKTNDDRTTITLPKTGVYRVDLIVQGDLAETIIWPLVNGVQDQRLSYGYDNGVASTFIRVIKPDSELSLQAGSDIELTYETSIDLASVLIEYVGELQLI